MGVTWLLPILLTQVPSPPPPIDLDWALALPLSPGAVALLVEEPTDPRALARLGEALAHEDPDVRAAAARVLYISGTDDLLTDAKAALEREADSSTAIELMWVVAAQGGPREAGVVVDAARRLDLALVAGTALATTQQHLALQHLDALRAIDRSSFSLKSFLTMAARFNFSSLGAYSSRALREHDGEFWTAYLESAGDLGAEADPGMLVVGMTAADTAMRAQTLWHIFLESVSGTPTPAVVEDALTGVLADSEVVEEPSIAFVLELLARSRGADAHESVEAIEALYAGGEVPVSKLSADVTLRLLTDRERRALGKLVRDDEDAYVERVKNLPPRNERASRAGSGRSRTAPTLTTVGGYPAGFVPDLLAVTYCDASRNVGLTIADVRYSLDGHRLGAGFHLGPHESEGCTTAGRALVLTNRHSVDPTTREAGWDRVLVLHTPTFMSCLQVSDSPRSVTRARSVKRNVEPPEKTKDKSPSYPESARQDRVQGTVILKSIITRTGCVQQIKVLRDVDERLDLAAVYAVSEWEYEPTTLDGVPVPIVMTVTVNFRLTY